MTRYLFSPSLAQHRRPSFEAIETLAAEYGTSRLATAMRCIDLGDWPVILVCHATTGRRWFKGSDAVPEKWFPRADLDPSSSAFPVLFGDVDRTPPRSINAGAWFDRFEASEYRITEQSVKAHGGEILTLLTLDTRMMN